MDRSARKGGRGLLIRRVVLVVLALAVIGIGAAKAVSALTPRSWSYGTLSGTFQAVGGPSGARPRALSGTITATTSNRGVLTFSVGADGRFTVQAVVGTYTVSGRSPQYAGGSAACNVAKPVTVSKGTTTRVTIDCAGA